MGGGIDPLTVGSLQPYTEAALIKGHLSPHNVWRQWQRHWRRFRVGGVRAGGSDGEERSGFEGPLGRNRIHGNRKQGGPGTEGLNGADVPKTLFTQDEESKALPSLKPSTVSPPNKHLLQRGCEHNPVPLSFSYSQSPLGQ